MTTTSEIRRPTPAPPGGPTTVIAPPAEAGVAVRSPAAVWWRAFRHHLRLLRTQTIAWILVIVGGGAAMISGYLEVYETQAQRDAAAANIQGVPAFEALFGRTVEMQTLEGFVLWRWGGFVVLLVAIWGLMSSVKLLRGAEEAHHLEPMRAGLVSPRGLLLAVLAALAVAYSTLAVATGLVFTGVGLDAATAWAFGWALALLAATFAAAGALAAQLFATRRQAAGAVGVFLGVALGVRVFAAGTSTPDWLWAATPFGWATYLHEVDGARPQVFAAFVALVAVLSAAALAAARRDLHAALVGDAHAGVLDAPAVAGHAALARRLVRGPLVGWGAGLALSGLVFGLLAEDFAAALVDLPDTVAAAERIGFAALDTPLGVAASLLVFLGLPLAVFAATQAAAIREEEASWRIEPVLVRSVGRVGWLVTRVAVAAAAVVVLAVLTAAGTWTGAALVGASLPLADLPRAALNLVPLAWLFLGLGVALFGLVPRLTAPLAYGAVVVTFLLDLVGGMMELPERVLELSPFRHTTAVPAAEWAVVPSLVMLAVGAVAFAVGVVAFRRRDLEEA